MRVSYEARSTLLHGLRNEVGSGKWKMENEQN
jgi:hypothetical protein